MPEMPGNGQLPQVPGSGDNGGNVGDSTNSDSLVPIGSGSGFIVDKDGHVITNAHVVAGAEKLSVTLSDGTEVPATLIGSDDLIDVAILKLDLPAGQSVPGVANVWRLLQAATRRSDCGDRHRARGVPQHGQ